MPRTIKPWFFTKAKEFSPTGTLQVGQILVERDNPAYVLMPGGPLPISTNVLQEPSSQTSVDVESKDDLTAMFGLWVNVSGLPAGGKAGANMSRSDELSWHFEKLTGNIISPSIAYLKAALQHGDVPAYTNRFHVIKRLYMVTGVKVVHGARMVKKTSSLMGVHGELKGDASEVAPVEGGVEGKVEKKNEDKESFQKASDFVYAYRLNEISYWGEPTHKPVVKGEAAGEGDEDSEEEDEAEMEPCVGGLKQESEEMRLAGVKGFPLPSAQDPEVEFQCFVATSK